MATKIFAQSIYMQEHATYGGAGYQTINDGVRRVYDKVLHPDTVVDVNFIPRSTWKTSHAYLEMLNNSEIVRGIIRSEDEGYDVAFVRCGNDPAIREARESVNIPVVAMSEASMHLACQLGARFACIGADAKSGPLMERNIRLYGLESRAIARKPVRIPTDPSWDAVLRTSVSWFETPEVVFERVVPAFEQVAHQCIDDGAEVIITGCALFSCFTLAGYNKITGTDVPVLESVAVGIKHAEMLGDLKRTLGISTSKHLTYQSLLRPEERAALIAPYYAKETA